MAKHYGIAVIPECVRKPKDKASVEGTVSTISNWVLGVLRKKLFCFLELNECIKEKLYILNNKTIQKKPGSRYSTFMEEEKHMLLPLPSRPYELATWKVATV